MKRCTANRYPCEQDLSSCMSRLHAREDELQGRIDTALRDAKAKKLARDVAGAKRKLVEKRRLEAQLDRLRSSIYVIETHANAIDGTELDKAVVQTLRASGDALKSLGMGIKSVEDVVSEAEMQLESAAEITRVLAAGTVSGMVNGGDFYTDDEIMRDLDELVDNDPDYEVAATDWPKLPQRRLESVSHVSNSMYEGSRTLASEFH